MPHEHSHDGVEINPEPSKSKLFPYDAVVGVLRHTDDVCDVVDELTSRGFAESEITLLSGREGIATIDPDGKRHGLLGRIFKKIDVLGDEHDETQAHLEALRQGDLVVGVRVDNDQEKTRALEVFKDHNGRHVSYYSRWTTETLIP